MNKEFIVFYNHTDYGYYSTEISAEDIVEALNDFNENWEHDGIYGIMQKR